MLAMYIGFYPLTDIEVDKSILIKSKLDVV